MILHFYPQKKKHEAKSIRYSKYSNKLCFVFFSICLDCYDITLGETTIYFLFRGDALSAMTKRMIIVFLMTTMVNSNYRHFND